MLSQEEVLALTTAIVYVLRVACPKEITKLTETIETKVKLIEGIDEYYKIVQLFDDVSEKITG